MPLHRRDGSYFGTLCALDPLPADLTEADFTIFDLLAKLIAFELEADEEQRRRQDELEALNNLISIAGHDLRQPLTVLQLRAQQLVRRIHSGTSLENMSGDAEKMVVDIRRVGMLTDSLMDLARIQTGGIRRNLSGVDLSGLVSQALQDTLVVTPEHRLVANLPEALVLQADEVKLGQVVRNLLDNAVKFSPDNAGTIEVVLSEETTADGTQQAHLQVQDSGIGVQSGELEQLFERQFRSQIAVRQQISGSGLGLYIARQIVEAHGGRIWAEHAPGGGLILHVTLPLQP